jgi:hypothetical protein
MTKGKDRTYNDQRKRQNIQWLKEKTEHTMTKGKDRTYNDQRKRQNIQWPKVNSKGIKGQAIIYKTLYIKLKIDQCEPPKKRGWTQVIWNDDQVLLWLRSGHHGFLLTQKKHCEGSI